MLREETVLALLQRHCRLLTRADWVNATYHYRGSWIHNGWDHVECGVRVELPHIRRRARRSGRDLGAKLRLALGVVQAVSCCRGFEPAAQQDFWRRTVRELWGAASYSCAFSATTFNHVGINWTSRSPDEDEFWVGFFHGTPEWNSRLSSILEMLRPHFVRGVPPPLRVSLLYCCASGDQQGPSPSSLHNLIRQQCVVYPDALKVILRAMLTTPTDLSATNPPATHLGLVVEYLMDQDRNSTLDTLDLWAQVQTLESPHLQLSIDQVTIQLASPEHARSEYQAPSTQYRRALVSRGRALGRVLRLLLGFHRRAAPRVRTVTLLECNLSDFRLVGAAVSAVALASPPVEELRCRGLFDASLSHDHLLRLAWLAYALHRCQGSSLSLSLVANGTAMTKSEREYLEQLVAIGMPLRDVVGETLRLRLGGDDSKVAQLNVECFPFGSSVRLAQGTRLFVEPMRVSDAFVAVTLDHDGDEEGVDLVAHVIDQGGFVGVVYGGYGILWADDSSVVEYQRRDNDIIMVEDNADGKQSFSLLFDSTVTDSPFEQFPLVHRATSILSVFACSTLDTLTLYHAVITHDDLTQLLESFPRLRVLALDRCAVESLAPLAAAYRARRTHVAVLSLLGARDMSMRDTMLARTHWMSHQLTVENVDRAVSWLTPLLDALTDGTVNGVLQEVQVDLMGMRDKDQCVVVAQLVASIRSLTRLHVVFEHRLWPVCVAQLAPLRDAVLRDPPRVRCAVLSVLRALGCAIPEIVRAMLAWSEGSVVRLVTWE